MHIETTVTQNSPAWLFEQIWFVVFAVDFLILDLTGQRQILNGSLENIARLILQMSALLFFFVFFFCQKSVRLQVLKRYQIRIVNDFCDQFDKKLLSLLKRLNSIREMIIWTLDYTT